MDKCCGVDTSSRRSKQYNETLYECSLCRRTVAIHDDGDVEILFEGVLSG